MVRQRDESPGAPPEGRHLLGLLILALPLSKSGIGQGEGPVSSLLRPAASHHKGVDSAAI